MNTSNSNNKSSGTKPTDNKPSDASSVHDSSVLSGSDIEPTTPAPATSTGNADTALQDPALNDPELDDSALSDTALVEAVLEYSMAELSPSALGEECGVLAARSSMLELMRVLESQGPGTPRIELTALSQELEAVIRAGMAAQVMLTGLMETERVAEAPLGSTYGWGEKSPHPQYRGLADLLVDTLRISRHEAHRRIKLSRALTRTTTLIGEQLPAPREGLREALMTGELSVENAGHIHRAVQEIKTLRTSPFEVSEDPDPFEDDVLGCPDTTDNESGEPDGLADKEAPGQGFASVEEQREFWAGQAEQYLCEQASSIGPDELKRLAKRWVLHVDPDGAEPTEKYLALKQGVFYLGSEQNLHTYLMRMTGVQHEIFTTNTLAIADRTDVAVEAGFEMGFADDTIRSAMGVAPTRAQKTLDALLAAFTHLDPSFSDTGPQSTVIATIDHDRLFNRLNRYATNSTGPTGSGQTDSTGQVAGDTAGNASAFEKPRTANSNCPVQSSPANSTGSANGNGSVNKPSPASETSPANSPVGGKAPGRSSLLARVATLQHAGPISASMVREIACEANIIPLVLSGKSEPLDLGRGARLFTRAQRLALAARDKGCIFPACTAPMFRCEAHHVNHWKAHGGETNVSNGALLCSYHHHVIHKGVFTLTIIDGKPWIIPPTWIDPKQTPRRNIFYALDQLGPPQTG